VLQFVPAPPPPTVTGTVPDALISIFLKPPPPPPPAKLPPEPPPPATITVLTTVVPGCSVKDPVAVLDVTVHFPKEDLLLLPIIPPFAEPDGLAIS
jgi:hypothetical protein